MSHRPGERPILRPSSRRKSYDDGYIQSDELVKFAPAPCVCGRSVEPGAQFCDACGEPLPATGVTTRLDTSAPMPKLADYGPPQRPFWK